ncbi:kelch-like protein 10 [Pungitius pungitius]|uniref:kelch-like protein 10 n=1 Tax=Pungitius pungitius TaxID=134920 RepID=UPI0018889EF7|nr:kelch-like protein 10 [Pungitius pungitius]
MGEEGTSSAKSNFDRDKAEKMVRKMASSAVNELLQRTELCDVVIKVEGDRFNAHKIILCSCSEYFCALFTGAWANPKKKSYIIPGVSPAMMRLIIDYAYTQNVDVTEDNVLELLAAADQFLVSGIVQRCCFFLEDQLCLSNCIGIWRLMHFYHLPRLTHKVFLFILQHFDEIIAVSQEILELSVQQLSAIIEHDHLNVRRESTVFETILHWISHQPDQRRGQIFELLSEVRLGLMTAIYLQDVVKENALIKDSAKCVSIIDAAVAKFMDLRCKSSKPDYSDRLSRPRLPSSILLVTGGKNARNAATGLDAYDARADCWVPIRAGEIRRNHHGAALLGGFMYVIGGRNRGIQLNTAMKFDLVNRTWHPVMPMNCCRDHVCVAVQNGCIYALGGFSDDLYHNSVERYTPETDQWTMVAPMHTKRSSASAATLRGKVYVCGGYNGTRSLTLAERYDPNTNQWTVIPNMRSSRRGLGIAAYKDLIYAIGGTSSGSIHLRTVETYNPDTDRWRNAPSMCCARSFFGLEVMEEQLIVVGGFGGTAAMLTVERYDDDVGMWLRASDMETPRSGQSCCVLHGLHGVMEDLFHCGSPTMPTVVEAAGGST